MKKKINYLNKVVLKPWGNEFLIFQNKNVAMWYLNIKKNRMTSFHCHPKKKTGFLLLEGQIEINLGFYEKIILKAPNKLMIRPGLFHKTKAINGEAKVIEIENPVNKSDLVRFSDSYGRKKKPYEGLSQMTKLDKNNIYIQKNFKSKKEFKLNDLSMQILKQKKVILKKKIKNSIFAILDGGLYFNKNCILGPGDIIRKNTFKKLIKSFKPKNYITYLMIN